jgi:hypothetical protein
MSLAEIGFDIAQERKHCIEYEKLDPWSAFAYYGKALIELLRIDVDVLDVDIEYDDGNLMNTFSALDLMMAIQIIRRFSNAVPKMQ